jgi:hypothetical protein
VRLCSKNKKPMITIHRTFEREKKKQITNYHIFDGNKFKVTKTFPSYIKNQDVMCTAVNTKDNFYHQLIDEGNNTLYFAYFHSAGIQKGLKVEELTKAFHQYATTNKANLLQFKPDKLESNLRRAIDNRNIFVQYSGDAQRRAKQMERDGYDITRTLEALKSLDSMNRIEVPLRGEKVKCKHNGKLMKIGTCLEHPEGVNKLYSPDDEVEFWAEKIKKVQDIKTFVGVEGSIGAASIIALSGGIERFPTPGQFLSYCGEGVKDGKALKMKEGSNVKYHRKLHSAIISWFISLAMTNKRIKSEIDMRVVIERAKDPNKSDGHTRNMAMKYVRKKLLIQIWCLCNPTLARKPKSQVVAAA